MARIVSSTATPGTQQPDGRFYVTETHVFGGGDKQTIIYMADPDIDIEAVLAGRAANINAELERRDREAAIANNFKVPIEVRDFLALIPAATRKQLRTKAKANEDMDDALAYLEAGLHVHKAAADAWLDSLVTANVIAKAVKDQIMASWTAQYG